MVTSPDSSGYAVFQDSWLCFAGRFLSSLGLST